MDHQLSDELILGNDMGVEFDHGEDVVVSQADITLEGSDIESMGMEFQHIEEQHLEEQPMVVEGCEEEIVGTESLSEEQYTLDAGDSYVVQDQKVIVNSLRDQSNMLRSDTMMDLRFDHQGLVTAGATNTSAHVVPTQIKAVQRSLAVVPRQVAIAPKPAPARPAPPAAPAAPAAKATKHVAIAPKLGPKPVALTAVSRANRSVGIKTMSLSDVMQGQKAGQAFITQGGKQFVMMPAGGSGQKIKLVPAAGQSMAQFITNTNKCIATVSKKPIMAKVIVTSQASSHRGAEQPAVITGVSGSGGGGGGAGPRFVHVQPKTIALSLANKIMGSPTKHGIRFTKSKQHIVTVQSTSPKAVCGPKIMLSEGGRNVVLKTAFPHKAAPAPVAAVGQRTQIHQINVPGKGVQYIRLVTNPTAAAAATTSAPVARPGRNVVFTDSKGNIIQMGTEKVLSASSAGQPPPLVVPGGASLSKVTAKPQQKLVRIAPIAAKVTHTNTMSQQQPARSGQSLLAPLAPPPDDRPPSPPSPPSLPSLKEQPPSSTSGSSSPSPSHSPSHSPSPPPAQPEDSKAALRALIEDAVRDEPTDAEDTNIETHEVEVDFERLQSPEQEEEEERKYKTNRLDKIDEHPLIVIPSNFEQHDHSNSDSRMDESYAMSFMNINPDITAYQQPSSPTGEEELGDRPRKACNCTKSQCLKLYCDCFANGEFCNRCNCTNCHNNLENEELRQKAIRGCLDRNPNAFRPKIGKARAGGPETIRRHNKGCNCKRSGCLKNYCECYEAKIACTAMCKCVGCRNVELALERLRRREPAREPPTGAGAGANALYRPPPTQSLKQPCSFMTSEVIEAVCQCLLASGSESEAAADGQPVEHVLLEFARCLRDIIGASQQGPALDLLDGSM